VSTTHKLLRFGVFEINLTTEELRNSGTLVKLAPQAFKLLVLLAGHAGEIVTRDDIQKLLWGGETFVDFDKGVNKCILLIRNALNDRADRPLYIETIPRRGYRFLAPVKSKTVEVTPGVLESGPGMAPVALVKERLAAAPPATIASAAVQEPANTESAAIKLEPGHAHVRAETFDIGILSPQRSYKRFIAAIAALLIVVLAAILVLRGPWSTKKANSKERVMVADLSQLPPIEVVPAAAVEGKQGSPALSPDGNQVAFAQYNGEKGLGIYTTIIGSDQALRLTKNAGDCCPTWSPDNRSIAFIRYSEEGTSIYVTSAIGGTERRLYTGTSEIAAKDAGARNRLLLNAQGISLSWSPDGKVLAFPESFPGEIRTRIAFLSLSDLSVRPFTSPPNQERDDGPAFSPDGSMLAFARGGAGGRGSDLFVVPVKGGEPKRITSGNSGVSPVWTQDGRDLVFSSASERGFLGLWRISASGGTPSPVIGLSSVAFSPSISRTGNELVYQHSVGSDNIWRLNLKDETHSTGPAVRVISARGSNWRPSFSPDGKKLAFESDRLGYSDIWECDSDGSNCGQVTSLRGTAGTARWSPDGRYIAFECQIRSYYQVYVVEVPAGTPRVVPTFPGSDNGAPNWSRDGQWIYFYSDREKGPLQLWKISFKGGVPIRVTNNGGVYATESDDHRFLYYSKLEKPGIWRMPINGGDEERILDQPEAWFWHSWALGQTGIYYLDLADSPTGKIMFFDLRTNRRTTLFNLQKPASTYGGLALSPDHKSLLYGQSEFQESFIMLVRNFR
jgi:Tol biopolymer transport system component/DNA-binding winged helix-turn-helix (wHTH) protein